MPKTLIELLLLKIFMMMISFEIFLSNFDQIGFIVFSLKSNGERMKIINFYEIFHCPNHGG